MKPSQVELIRKQLIENGSISRNWCLKNFITRLGARIDDLKREGMKINGKFVKTDFGTDYVYTLIKPEPVKEIITIGKKFETKKWFDNGWQETKTAIKMSESQSSLF